MNCPACARGQKPVPSSNSMPVTLVVSGYTADNVPRHWPRLPTQGTSALRHPAPSSRARVTNQPDGLTHDSRQVRPHPLRQIRMFGISSVDVSDSRPTLTL